MDRARDIAKIQKQVGGKEARCGPLVKGVGHEGAIGLTTIGLSREREHKLPFLLGSLLSIVFFWVFSLIEEECVWGCFGEVNNIGGNEGKWDLSGSCCGVSWK